MATPRSLSLQRDKSQNGIPLLPAQQAPATPSPWVTTVTDTEKWQAPRNTPSLWSRLAVDWWTWELVAASLSLATVAAICDVLIAYDQKPVPRLPHDITVCFYK